MLSWPALNFVSLMPVVFVRACSTSASLGTYPLAPIRLTSSKKLVKGGAERCELGLVKKQKGAGGKDTH